MFAMHFICGRDDGVSLNNLFYDKASNTWRSGTWDITLEEAAKLVGGWVYLHPAKAVPSEFGGVVKGFEPIVVSDLSHSDRIVFLVESKREGRRQRWRGKDHGMAHGSGLVEATLPHERQSGQ